MKKFISTCSVLVLTFTIYSCDSDMRGSGPDIADRIVTKEANTKMYSKGSDSAAFEYTDEEPRRDPQQWRTRP